MKIGFISLGCPKNQLDTEVMLHEVVAAGYELTSEDIDADIIIINTCAFIESAKQEAIDNILDVAWLKEHRKLKGIVVTGCLAERYQSQIFDEIPEVDAVIGVGSIHRIVKAVDAVAKGLKFSAFDDKNESPLGGDRILTTPEYMAYIKIAEGCDNHCTYCIIPAIRGKYRSRTIEDIVAEAITLEELGVKELIVIAQDITRYGTDLTGKRQLHELLRELCKLDFHWILQLPYSYAFT